MKVFIFGGTGFIGRYLIPELEKQSFEVMVFTRRMKSAERVFGNRVLAVEWDTDNEDKLLSYFKGNYSIINLAGENIGEKPWTQKQKQKILNSRVTVSSAIASAVNKAIEKPVSILQSSAVGFYGSQGDNWLNEESPIGSGFLPFVVKNWESAMNIIDPGKTRVVFLRTGIVLGSQSGFLPKIVLPFKFFAGLHFGSGKQWLSWIHINDVVRSYIFLLNHKTASGNFNLSNPQPVIMKDFCKELGLVLNRPYWLSIPSFILKLFMGERAKELLLVSQRVYPERLLKEGFSFEFLELEGRTYKFVKNKMMYA